MSEAPLRAVPLMAIVLLLTLACGGQSDSTTPDAAATQNAVAGTGGATISEFDLPTRDGVPHSIAIDSAGRLWFTEFQGNKLGTFDPASERLAGWGALIGVAPGDVLFVGDAMRAAAIAEAAGFRFIGLARPGHPDGFAGSGIGVVTSLAAVARQVVHARRLPVSVGNGYRVRSTPEESLLAAVAVEVAEVVRPQEVRKAVDDAHRRDGAVGDLDMAVDFRPRAEGPGNGGSHYRVVGEHHSSAGDD